jgi:Transposase IS116/IS110/IS902 family
VLARLGVPVTCTGIFGVWGNTWLDGLALPQPYAGKAASLRHLAGELTAGITLLEKVTGDLLEHHDGYHALQQPPGTGPVLAAVIVAEIGDIRRFHRPGQLCSWAGLPPRQGRPAAPLRGRAAARSLTRPAPHPGQQQPGNRDTPGPGAPATDLSYTRPGP